MIALILAAGYATRLYPYTINTPKPLLPLAGRAIIDYIVKNIETLPNIDKIVVISNGRFISQFDLWQKEKNNSKIKVLNDNTCSVETRLGAIGDIQFALEAEKIDDDIIVVAGDNFFEFNLLKYYTYFKEKGSDCICAKRIDDIEVLKSLGVCELDENNKVIGFQEKPSEPKANTAVYAIYMFKKESIHYVSEYLEKGNKRDAPGYFIEWLHKKSDVHAYVTDSNIYDIGTVAAYEQIKGCLQGNITHM